MSPTRIAQLATLVAANIAKVDEYLRSHNLPSPSFDVDSPVDFGFQSDAPEIEEARIAAIEASMELQDLLTGPIQLLRPNVNATSLQAIYKFEIAAKVPIHGEISYAHLAELCGLYELDLRRILRFAMVHHRVFYEPRKGFVRHTAASRRLAEDSGAQDGVGFMYDECWQSMARTVEAMQRFKGREPNETGYSLAHETDDSVYEYLDKHPEKAKRFAGAMKSFTSNVSTAPLHLIKQYPWHSIGKGTVVDVGGSEGHVSIGLAQAYSNLSFIVQDRAQTVAGAESKVPAAVADRVKFMAHDFFETQPITADVYLFRWIFHNWPDDYCVAILKRLVPALKSGARIVINDSLVPEPNILPLIAEKNTRAMDMLMLTMHNARERERDDWEALLKRADERFILTSAIVPEKSSIGVIEVIWEG